MFKPRATTNIELHKTQLHIAPIYYRYDQYIWLCLNNKPCAYFLTCSLTGVADLFIGNQFPLSDTRPWSQSMGVFFGSKNRTLFLYYLIPGFIIGIKCFRLEEMSSCDVEFILSSIYIGLYLDNSRYVTDQSLWAPINIQE